VLSDILISTVGSVNIMMNAWSDRRSRAGSCSRGSRRSMGGWQQSITLGQLTRVHLEVIIISLDCRYSQAFSEFSPG